MHSKRSVPVLIALVFLFLAFSAVAEQGGGDTELVSNALPVDFSGGAKPDPAGYIGEWEYKDPTIHVKVETGRANECDYWVADIQIGHASQLRTVAAEDFTTNMAMPGTAIAQRVGAILAINGDYFSFTRKGFIVRQGELFKDKLEGRRDLLLIDEEGDFHFIHWAQKDEGVMEIDGKKIINAFFFGPIIVENGEAITQYRVDEMAVMDHCQRMCIAQVGRLHYKVVCCAAPARGSEGMRMKEFAELVRDLGIQNAYNLDGGDSTMMIFGGEKINDVDNPKTRNIVDMIYFASSATNE